MREELPVACSMSGADLADRTRTWARLINGWSVSSSATPDGVRVQFRTGRGLRESLGRLVAMEAECCPWMGMTLVDGPPLVLIVTGPKGTFSELEQIFGVERTPQTRRARSLST